MCGGLLRTNLSATRPGEYIFENSGALLDPIRGYHYCRLNLKLASYSVQDVSQKRKIDTTNFERKEINHRGLAKYLDGTWDRKNLLLVYKNVSKSSIKIQQFRKKPVKA